jgi:hypothetical protein
MLCIVKGDGRNRKCITTSGAVLDLMATGNKVSLGGISPTSLHNKLLTYQLRHADPCWSPSACRLSAQESGQQHTASTIEHLAAQKEAAEAQVGVSNSLMILEVE